MAALLRSEWIKLRSVRTTWILTGVGLALEATYLVLIAALVPVEDLAEDAASLLTGVGLGFLLVLVLGAICFTNEYRHATTTSTYLVTPDRVRVLAAKLLVAVAFGLAAGLVFALLSGGLANAILASRDVGVSGADLWPILVGCVLAYGLACGFGVGLGAVLRNQVGAIVGAVGVFFVLSPLGFFLGDVAKFLPQQAITSLQGAQFDDELLGQVAGGLVLLAYVVLLVVVGAVLVRRSDVTE